MYAHIPHSTHSLTQSCESPLAKAAAIDCLDELNKQLGRAIMRGRVEQHNRNAHAQLTLVRPITFQCLRCRYAREHANACQSDH